jgi:hypothetical protein
MFKKLFLLFVVGLFMGSITVVVYGGFHICTGCKGNRDYCTTGNSCKTNLGGRSGIFIQTKSGKYCNGWGLGCTDKYYECWCETPGGSIGDANADYPGC